MRLPGVEQQLAAHRPGQAGRQRGDDHHAVWPPARWAAQAAMTMAAALATITADGQTDRRPADPDERGEHVEPQRAGIVDLAPGRQGGRGPGTEQRVVARADILGPQQDETDVAGGDPTAPQRARRGDDERDDGDGDEDRPEERPGGAAPATVPSRATVPWSADERRDEQRDGGEQPQAVQPLEADRPTGVGPRPLPLHDAHHHRADDHEDADRHQADEARPAEVDRRARRRPRRPPAPTRTRRATRRRRPTRRWRSSGCAPGRAARRGQPGRGELGRRRAAAVEQASAMQASTAIATAPGRWSAAAARSTHRDRTGPSLGGMRQPLKPPSTSCGGPRSRSSSWPIVADLRRRCSPRRGPASSRRYSPRSSPCGSCDPSTSVDHRASLGRRRRRPQPIEQHDAVDLQARARAVANRCVPASSGTVVGPHGTAATASPQALDKLYAQLREIAAKLGLPAREP